jgi:hypothetical protein
MSGLSVELSPSSVRRWRSVVTGASSPAAKVMPLVAYNENIPAFQCLIAHSHSLLKLAILHIVENTYVQRRQQRY